MHARTDFRENGRRLKLQRVAPAEDGWKFLTNHAHVLLCLARNPTARTKDLAQWIGITDRAAQRIVAELERDGYLSSVKVGRGKRYKVNARRSMRHALQDHHSIDALLRLKPRLPPSGDGR